MDAWTFKLISMAVIFLTGLGGGVAPLRIEHSKSSAKIFSLSNLFAGGIFLSAGFVHMLGDANSNLDPLNFAFPIVPGLCIAAILLILFLERVVLTGDDIGEQAKGKDFAPYMLVIILSVHSIIAGISLGAETSLSDTIIIFIAIIAHKGSAAFALGVSMARAQFPAAKLRKIIALFSLSTPLGILLGSVISQWLTGQSVVIFEGVFDSLAAGTFIYVATFEIIAEEFENRENRWGKFGLLFIGAAFMAMLALWT